MLRTKTKLTGAAKVAMTAKSVMIAIIALLLSSATVYAHFVENCETRRVCAEGQEGEECEEIRVCEEIDALSGQQRVVGLTILVAFPEGNRYDLNGPTGGREPAVRSNISPRVIEDFLNRPGGAVDPATGRPFNAEGSVRDWFLNASNGLLDYTNIVTPMVYVDSAKSFYDRGPPEDLTERGRPYIRYFIESALNRVKELAESGRLDLRSLTTETDPNRRGGHAAVALNILYSGRAAEGWGRGLWPHASSRGSGVAINIGGKTITFHRYQITNMDEQSTPGGRPPTLGTFVHENGHSLLRWPDLYAYPNQRGWNETTEIVGGFCNMSVGAEGAMMTNPYFRHRAGWVDVVDIAGFYDTTITITANAHTVYRYVRNNRESYYIEARRRAGNSANIPGEGLLIWHVREGGRNSEFDQKAPFPLVRLVQANNPASVMSAFPPGMRPNAGAPFRAGGGTGNRNDANAAGRTSTEFHNASPTPARYHDSTLSNIRITGISAVPSGNNMAMTFRTGRRRGTPRLHNLLVENGSGGGYYAAGQRAAISAPARIYNDRYSYHEYFFRWADSGAVLERPYARETRVTMPDRWAIVGAEYTNRGYYLPGRITGGRPAAFGGGAASHNNTADFRRGTDMSYALYAVNIDDDGEYQLTYGILRMFAGERIVGTMRLIDLTNGVVLDTIRMPAEHSNATQTVVGKIVNLKKGAATWRLEAMSGTNVYVAYIAAHSTAPVELGDIEMVRVGGGTFTMGCTPEQEDACKRVLTVTTRDREIPTFSATVSDFSIGRYEVTQRQWKAVMEGVNPSDVKQDDLPVTNVNWNDVQTFITRLNAMTGKNYRLPTEAEWEFAARGGNWSGGFRFSGGNDLNLVAWHNENSGGRPHPVGTKQPNELGLYDMSGNVEEWVFDRYEHFTDDAKIDPVVPPCSQDGGLRSRANCDYRVSRSSCWRHSIHRISRRYGSGEMWSSVNRGFRLAGPPELGVEPVRQDMAALSRAHAARHPQPEQPERPAVEIPLPDLANANVLARAVSLPGSLDALRGSVLMRGFGFSFASGAAFAQVRASGEMSWAIFAVSVPEDGEYQLTYNIMADRDNAGSLRLVDAASGNVLDTVNAPVNASPVLRPMRGGRISLKRGHALLRLEAPPGTQLRISSLDIAR